VVAQVSDTVYKSRAELAMRILHLLAVDGLELDIAVEKLVSGLALDDGNARVKTYKMRVALAGIRPGKPRSP
jgi:hypothetical protein